MSQTDVLVELVRHAMGGRCAASLARPSGTQRGLVGASVAAQHLFCCLGGGCGHSLASCAHSVGYGPRKRTPLKWIRCDGASATHTSVSHAISPR